MYKKYKLPKGVYLTTWDWIKESSKNNQLANSIFRVIYSKETFEFRPPKGFVPSPPWPTTCTFPEAFVTILPNGRVWGKHGSIITPDNKLLWDISAFKYKSPSDHPIFKEKALRPITFYPGSVATIAWGPKKNYYHWLFDFLPRIHLIQKSGIPIDYYVVNENILPYQIKTIKMLGIPVEKLIKTNPAFHIKAKRLVVPSLARSRTIGACPKWAYNFVRNKFLKYKSLKKLKRYDRIYISRNDANRRKVLNEDQVINTLSKYGFKKVVLSSLPISKQISILSSAKIIIGPLGANLTNLTFCEPRTKVITLLPKTFPCDIFWKISNYGKLDYYNVECSIKHPPKPSPKDDDIIVDLDKLLSVMNLAEII